MKKEIPRSVTHCPRLFLLAFFILFLHHPSALGRDGKKRMFWLTGDKTSAQLPFTLVNNLVVVSAVLNGNLPVNLILDTGSATNLLTDPRISRKLNQPEARTVTISGPGTGQEKLYGKIMTNLSLEMKGIEGRNLAMVATTTKPAFLKRISNTPIHGILGYPFFTQFVVTIDYRKNLVILSETTHFTPNLKAKALPFSLANSKPVLSTSLNVGEQTFPGRLLFDTGAAHDLMLFDEVGARTVKLLQTSIRGTLGNGFGGAIYGARGTFHNLKVGPINFRSVEALFPELGQYHKAASFSQDGSIGGGLLKEFVVTIDYLRETLYLFNPDDRQQVAYQTEVPTQKKLLHSPQRAEPPLP